jgi:hypothetical protein
MAIDQDIEQRVNAYRSNPQALQQRYAANQELLDLLALQRLKSEKDDAARQVQMEMQQNPQTIKQQKERQLLDMTKQDLVNQTAGIMQNAQQRQQKNVQRIAKQGAASPQQMQRVASGLGALAQRQRQPQRPQQAPMGRMAAGGIVAFAEGEIVNGEITQEEIDEYRQYARAPRTAGGLTDEQIRAILERNRVPERRATRRGLRPTRATSTGAPILPTGTGQDNTISEAKNGEIDQANSAQNAEERRKKAGPADARVLTGPESNQTNMPEGILAMYQEQDRLTAPKIDVSDPYAGAAEMLETVGIDTTVDPEAARVKARDEAASYLGREEKRGAMNQYLEDLKAMDARQQDPKKMRDEQISAFLRGTAGGGSFGQTMAAGSGAMATERQNQEQSERERLLKRIGIDADSMKRDVDIGTQALADGSTVYQELMKQRANAAEAFSAYRGQNLNLAIEKGKNEYNANKDNIKNLLDAANIQFTKALQETMAAADREVRAGNTLRQLGEYKINHEKEYILNDPAVQEAQNILNSMMGANSRAKPEDIKKAREAVKKATVLASAAAHAQLSKSGLLELEQAFMNVIKRGGAGVSPSESDVEKAKQSITLSEEEESAMARNLPE